MESLTVIKLGGSAITKKSADCTPNIQLIENAVEQLATHRGPIILLHGGGSYAHPVVTRSRLDKGYKSPSQRESFSETELNLDQLSRIIGVSLLLNNKPFVPLHPISFVMLKKGRISRFFPGPLLRSVALGFIPLLHGDLAFDESSGWGIVSADKLATLFAIRLNASRVLFGCDVDGVYSRDPKRSDDVVLIRKVTRSTAPALIANLTNEPSDDATGGMLGKATEAVRIAQKGTESLIFNLHNPNALKQALSGKLNRCTRFIPWS